MSKTPTQLSEVGQGAQNVPVRRLSSLEDFSPHSEAGALRYQAPLGDRMIGLDALFVNKGSDTLVVALHGAMVPGKYTLPRFEWLRSLSNTPYSSFYFSDPTLLLDEQLLLTWYVGWVDLDLYPVLASWVNKTVKTLGIRHVVILGSSGGGFASLQLAPYVPDSLALPFSPQTSISRYTVNGSATQQERFVDLVMPHLAPNGFKTLPDGDWSIPLGDRASPVRRYQKLQQNKVFYVQNLNDVSHYHDHYLPFKETVENSPNRSRVRFKEYQGPERHNPPKQETFQESLKTAVVWASESASGN